MPRPPVSGVAGREAALVIPRALAFPAGVWHGVATEGLERMLQVIRASGEFRPRAVVEEDPLWQQVIPHMVVCGEGGLLVMRRLRASSERRLHNQVTIGVGGHINPGDATGGRDPLLEGCRREWEEEVACADPVTGRLVGLLKDDQAAVGRVHLGLVIRVDVGPTPVAVREHTKLSGEILPIAAVQSLFLQMESWSQLVYEALAAGRLDPAGPAPLTVELPATADGPAPF